MSTPNDRPPPASGASASAMPIDPADAPPAGAGGMPGLDFGQLEQIIQANRRPTLLQAAPSAPKPDPVAGHLDELAEDLLDLLRRVKGLEAAQADVAVRLDRIEATARDGARLQARETDHIRRELLGEHNALAARATAEAVFPVLDQLRPIRAAVNPRRNAALANQLDAALELLGGMLRAFGFLPFEPPLGAPFDPGRMRCAGEKKGPQGVVLGLVQPGYTASDIVLRPAGVLLAPGASAPREVRP